jgi:hypothetical protein
MQRASRDAGLGSDNTSNLHSRALNSGSLRQCSLPQQSYHLTFCGGDQPLLWGEGEISRDLSIDEGKSDETATIFIRPSKK